MAEADITAMTPDCPRCPRCDVDQTRVVAHSPVDGAWRMYACPTCFYSWRSTEPAEQSTREGIAPGFRIDPAKVSLGRVMPSIPPLRTKR